jgi:hypothetical protein
MITTADIYRQHYPEIKHNQTVEDCGELQFCIDLIHWPRFDISWSYRAIFSFVIFMGIMLYG